ncbi:Protein translocase subunit SecE [Buchnera aphidicola (Periphyllus testudinaceus)]|uniref:preprotein translocase subunit SecE n=1 Tax=Buchnera aphidicola TaxID=9 RepID=UPI00346415F5
MKSKILNTIFTILKKKKCVLGNILIIFIMFFIKKYNFPSTTLKYFTIFIFLLSLIIIILIINKYYTFLQSIYKDIQIEIKNITWPKKKDTLNTTFIIILISILISMVLWGLDNIIFYLISFITSIKY